MDIDLLSDLLEENHEPLYTQLLQNLPSSRLTTADPQIAPDFISCPPTALAQRSALPPAPNRAGSVILKIENIFDSIVACVMGDKKELAIQLKCRSNKNNTSNNDIDVDRTRKSDIRRIKFPSKCPMEAWRFGRSDHLNLAQPLISLQLLYVVSSSCHMKLWSLELLLPKGCLRPRIDASPLDPASRHALTYYDRVLIYGL